MEYCKISYRKLLMTVGTGIVIGLLLLDRRYPSVKYQYKENGFDIILHNKIMTPETVKQPTKVVFLTYSRSGSSFLGEVINRNPSGFYYFEPLFGIYAYMYGLPFGVTSSNFFYTSNRTERYAREYEAKMVSQQLNDLLSCRLDSLPTELHQTPFIFRFNKQVKYNPYISCFKNVSTPQSPTTEPLNANGIGPNSIKQMQLLNGKGPNFTQQMQLLNFKNKKKSKKKSQPPNSFAYLCKTYIQKYCKTFNGVNQDYCFKLLFGKEFPLDSRSISETYLNDNLHGFTNSSDRGSSYFSSYPEIVKPWPDLLSFNKHYGCMKTSRTHSNKCIKQTQLSCLDSNIIGAKVIRMRMENVAYLLALDPNIKVVHYFRDPRGTLLSRCARDKSKKHMNMVKGAVTLCQQMMQDIYVRKQLEKKYPKNFLVLKYEDFATFTEATLERLYTFFDQPVVEEVRDWLYNSTHGEFKNKAEYRNILGTSRRNSTATANTWKKTTPPAVIKLINTHCKDFLKEMDYQIFA